MSFRVIQGGRASTKDDARLFHEARTRISKILALIDEYEGIRQQLEDRGYGLDFSEGRILDIQPVPSLMLDGGCIVVDGPELLDEWEQAGPLPKKVADRYRRQIEASREVSRRAAAAKQVAL